MRIMGEKERARNIGEGESACGNKCGRWEDHKIVMGIGGDFVKK